MRKDQFKVSNDQLAIFNKKHKEKLSFTGCDEWIKKGGFPSGGRRDRVFSIAN